MSDIDKTRASYWWDNAAQRYEEILDSPAPVRRVEQEHFVTPAERMAKEIVQRAIQGTVYHTVTVPFSQYFIF